MDNRTENREANMEKIEKLTKQVNAGKSKLFELDVNFVTGSGVKYVGKVVMKRPTVGDYLAMGRTKARMLQTEYGQEPVDPNFIDVDIKFVATLLSTLKHQVVSHPDWMSDLENFMDWDVLTYIYDLYEVWLNSFRRPGTSIPAGNSEATQGTDVVVDS